ncbi:[Fe-Fe] hydrogenase large subunit C-terminal domain-containing protein [Defluviitalea phaphyphila]|uniref:[Fe-Fe] hydrogenase large subunit C-terminal domain-containing protein n=1 Tax=Defluviitalea phaphyphila TaxID=1473580 RepID=UPI0007315703|nr:[Fe-Fe] hydrogenase large subunit C-terminal domain-containing protein [Defluviitalea phaphyphila]
MCKHLHSVTLQEDKCRGCTDCIKRCPTEAIRVRNGKAKIINERCIDCGMCIKVCKNHAKKAVTDTLDSLSEYKYKVAMPAPTLYAQFKNILDVNVILTGLKKLGFDEIFEVARGAEIVTEASKKMIKNSSLKKPIISSVCPVIVRLIQIRFPELIDNILPIMSPMEVAARIVKTNLINKGFKKEDIGIFFISPCAAKATNAKNPIGFEKSFVDKVISIRDVYMKLIPIIKKIDKVQEIRQSTRKGIGWAMSGGEGEVLGIDNYIAVDGIENVNRILEQVENGKLEDVEFIEGLACDGGCLGGPLTVENSFVAKNHLKKVLNYSMNQAKNIEEENFNIEGNLTWNKEVMYKPVMTLDEDMEKAIKKMEELERIYEKLPHIDCGSCGTPNCRALAEDIVRNNANIEDCIFMLRQKVRKMAEDMVCLSQKLPPAIGREKM